MHLCWKPTRHGRWRVYEQKCDTCILVKTPSFKCSVWPFSWDVCLNCCFEAGLLFQDGGMKSTAKMYFFWPTWKLGSLTKIQYDFYTGLWIIEENKLCDQVYDSLPHDNMKNITKDYINNITKCRLLTNYTTVT